MIKGVGRDGQGGRELEGERGGGRGERGEEGEGGGKGEGEGGGKGERREKGEGGKAELQWTRGYLVCRIRCRVNVCCITYAV